MQRGKKIHKGAVWRQKKKIKGNKKTLNLNLSLQKPLLTSPFLAGPVISNHPSLPQQPRLLLKPASHVHPHHLPQTMTTISSRTNLPLTESTRKHQPSLSYREHASHSNSNHAFLLSRDKTDASERKDEQKIQREKQGKHGKENHRNKRTKKSTTGTSRRKEHKQKKTQRDQPARPRHRLHPFVSVSSFLLLQRCNVFFHRY